MQVLFQDPHLIAVNKPGGLAVQADKTGDPHLLEHVAELFPADRHLGLPHRLDRPVSGAIIITRTAEALAAMGDLFSARGVEKTYWAIVHGAPPSAGVWEHRLSHDTRLHKARVLNDIEGASSRVSFKRLAAGDHGDQRPGSAVRGRVGWGGAKERRHRIVAHRSSYLGSWFSVLS